MTRYTLQTTVTAAGTVKIYLESPQAGLTIPSFASVNPGDVTARIDSIAGVQEIDSIDLTITEDYGTYAEGFWQKVLGYAYADICITLNDASTEACFFFGRVQPGATRLAEKQLGSGIVREGVIHCLSMLYVLQSINLADVDTALMSSGYVTVTTVNGGTASDYHFATLSALFSQALALGTGQAYASTDTAILTDDFQLSTNDSDWYGWADLYFARFNLLDTSTGWSARYVKVWDLMVAICMSLGVVPRYRYDFANSRHKIDLMVRGRSYAVDTTTAYPYESVMIIGTPSLVNYIQIDSGAGGGSYYYNVAEATGVETEPAGWTPDMTIIGEAGCYSATAAHDFVNLFRKNGTDCSDYNYARFYDYGVGWAASSRRLDQLLSLYYSDRLGGVKRAYERKYDTLKGNNGTTNTFANTDLFRNCSINDGVASKSFYATEVQRNVQTAEAFVRWQEV